MSRSRMAALVSAFRAGAGGARKFRCDVTPDSASMYIYDVIGAGWGGGIDPKDVVSALGACNGKPLDIYMNSPGGDVFDGIAIHSALARYGNTKTMHVDGLAASAASLILMAGDKIVCAPAGQIMIHDPWAMTVGNADAHTQQAALLASTAATLVDVYAARTKQSAKDVGEWMKSETWMTSGEALARGFCDSIAPVPGAGDDDRDPDGDQDSNMAARKRVVALLETFKRSAPAGRPVAKQKAGQPASK